MESNAATSLITIEQGPQEPKSGISSSPDVPSALVMARSQLLSLTHRENTPAELALSVFSVLQQVVRAQLGTLPRGENLEEFFHSLVAPHEIENSFRSLYEQSRGFLFSLVHADLNLPSTMPSMLWLEEVEELITWVERRQHHLRISENYKLAEEGFFNSRVISDVKRQGEYGAVIKSCLNLDSRGSENLFLTVKILWRGMPLKTSERYNGWSEADTDHWLYELPLQTKGSRELGRTIIDDLDIFIPYASLLWGKEFLGRKTADVTLLVSVLDRRGVVTLSERIPASLRVDSNVSAFSSAPLRSPMETGLVEVCPLRGHRIENMSAHIEEGYLRVSSNLTVFDCAGQDVQFDLRILDATGGTLHEEFYVLKPITSIARFTELGTAISIDELNLHPEQVVAPKQIELVITAEDGKVLCGGVVSIT